MEANLNQILSSVDQNEHILVIGDFNYNILSDPTNIVFPPLKDYNQLVREPTTLKGTLLDHIYVNNSPPNPTAVVRSSHYSYHDPLQYTFQLDQAHSSP